MNNHDNNNNNIMRPAPSHIMLHSIWKRHNKTPCNLHRQLTKSVIDELLSIIYEQTSCSVTTKKSSKLSIEDTVD